MFVINRDKDKHICIKILVPTETVLNSKTWRFKEPAPDASKEQRANCRRVELKARKEAKLHFDPEAHEASKAK